MEEFRLNELRKEVDALDAIILGLLRRREELCIKIGIEKKRLGSPILDAKREEEVLKRAGRLAPLYERVVSYCRELQEGAFLDVHRAPPEESIGIIGVGKMGYWFAEFFRERGFSVSAYDTVWERVASTSRKLGVEACLSPEEVVAKSSVILISTPMKEVPAVIENVKKILESGGHNTKMVFDIASFKEGIVERYRGFPNEVKVASTHPFFGPRARIVDRHSIAVVPVPGREDNAKAVAEFFDRLGFKTLIVDAGQHDALMSITIGGSYATSIILAKLLAKTVSDLKHSTLNATFKYYLVYALNVLGEDVEFLVEVFEKDSVKRLLEAVSREVALMRTAPRAMLEKIEARSIREKLLEGSKSLSEPASIIYTIVESVFES